MFLYKKFTNRTMESISSTTNNLLSMIILQVNTITSNVWIRLWNHEKIHRKVRGGKHNSESGKRAVEIELNFFIKVLNPSRTFKNKNFSFSFDEIGHLIFPTKKLAVNSQKNMDNFQHVNADEALDLIKSGDRVFVHGSAATPLFLLNLLLKRAGEISDVEIVSISMFGEVDWKQPGVTDSFYLNSLFVSSNIRE